MKILAIVISLFITSISFAQQPLLKQYSVSCKLNDECRSGVNMVLFDSISRKDSLNQMVLNELLKWYNNPPMIFLEDLYANKEFVGDERPYLYTVAGTSTFAKNQLFSFIACAYNACDRNPRSNYETTSITVDAATGKMVTLQDIIDPVKRDTFDQLVYRMATMYRIKNVPTCYVSLSFPIEVKSANSTVNATDTVTYYHGTSDKFYLKDGQFVVYNKAEHRDYPYQSVEVALPFSMLSYFVRPGMAKRLGI